VHTQAQSDFKKLYYQRVRWLGKWHLYADGRVKWLTLFLALVNVTNLGALLLVCAGWYESNLFFVQILGRILLEFIFLGLILGFAEKKSRIFHIPVMQLVYNFYLLFIIISTVLSKQYIWKERKIKTP
ncbi:MAG: hypothetical protein H7Y04_06090, partial [Verrucomicrobia bacterium]|nr:hypothetical protein [Cytophagales bacterium]